MKTVWKYTLTSDEVLEVSLPINAEVLSVQEQYGEPQMWVLVDPRENITEKRFFRLSGTGHPITESIKSFIGTFQLYNGTFVGHLFEIYC